MVTLLTSHKEMFALKLVNLLRERRVLDPSEPLGEQVHLHVLLYDIVRVVNGTYNHRGHFIRRQQQRQYETSRLSS